MGPLELLAVADLKPSSNGPWGGLGDPLWIPRAANRLYQQWRQHAVRWVPSTSIIRWVRALASLTPTNSLLASLTRDTGSTKRLPGSQSAIKKAYAGLAE
jgi:hypothetical protein